MFNNIATFYIDIIQHILYLNNEQNTIKGDNYVKCNVDSRGYIIVEKCNWINNKNYVYNLLMTISYKTRFNLIIDKNK